MFLTNADLNSSIKYTFKRSERLKSKKLIASLFSKGSYFVFKPIKLVCLPVNNLNGSYPVQVGFVVSKARFKHAVDRNRIKRQIREAYRLNKPNFYQQLAKTNKKFALMFIYTSNKFKAYAEIELAVKQALQASLNQQNLNN